MGRKAAEMAPVAVARLRVPGLHAIGGVSGLYLQVLPSGGRSWVLRAMIGGKRRDMGLGGFPDVTVAGAREAARRAREKIDNGQDPIEVRQKAKMALRADSAKALTFEEAAKTYIAAHESSWRNAKHREQWRNTLQSLAYPHIGKLSVRDIDLPHILAVLTPVWRERTETAARLRGRIESVLDWATARGYRDGLNPARWRGHLDKMLPNPSKIKSQGHLAALPVADVGLFMSRLGDVSGLGARALEFAILAAARSGEVRGAEWREIDLSAKVWTIPAARMKAGREHRVPLTPAMLSILQSLPRFGDGDLVFPSSKGRKLSDRTLLAVLRRMEIPVTVHGFRSTFRDWCGEYTNFPREIAEAALAHSTGNAVEQAYRRGDALEKRRRLMEAWAAFITKSTGTSRVISIRDPIRGRR